MDLAYRKSSLFQGNGQSAARRLHSVNIMAIELFYDIHMDDALWPDIV
jgi:hypothetical protein